MSETTATSAGLRPGYEWRQVQKTRLWRLWEVDRSQQLMQWYHEGAGGRERLVRDADDHLLPSFALVEDGRTYLRQHRWGRYILGESV